MTKSNKLFKEKEKTHKKINKKQMHYENEVYWHVDNLHLATREFLSFFFIFTDSESPIMRNANDLHV